MRWFSFDCVELNGTRCLGCRVLGKLKMNSTNINTFAYCFACLCFSYASQFELLIFMPPSGQSWISDCYVTTTLVLLVLLYWLLKCDSSNGNSISIGLLKWQRGKIATCQKNSAKQLFWTRRQIELIFGGEIAWIQHQEEGEEDENTDKFSQHKCFHLLLLFPAVLTCFTIRIGGLYRLHDNLKFHGHPMREQLLRLPCSTHRYVF